MEKEKLIKLIKNKIQEHVAEIDGADFDKEAIQKKLKDVSVSLSNGNKDFTKELSKVMVLTNKILFHKGSISALTDLIKEIQKK